MILSPRGTPTLEKWGKPNAHIRSGGFECPPGEGGRKINLCPGGNINWTGSQTTQLQVAVAFLQNSRSRGEAARSDFSASLKKSWECRSTCGPKAHT